MSSALKEKIIERMEAKNLSIAELERRAGLSIHSVRNILKGRIKKPSAQSLQAIAEALECSIVDLINSSPSKRGEGYSPEFQGRMKKRWPLDYPPLMLDCSEKILKLISEKSIKVSVEEYLDVLKKVYFYSSREEPRKFDMRFAEWLIESQFDDQKTTPKT